MQDDIRKALAQLDPEDETHWTADGLPRIDVVEGLSDLDVTRAEVGDAAPGFSRADPNLPDAAPSTTAASDSEADDASDSDKAEAAAELEEAEAELAAAKKRHKAATDAMTALIQGKGRASSEEQAKNIKAYQESQKKQRGIDMEKQAALQEFLKSA